MSNRDLCGCRIVIVTSLKGGVGKSTVTANLALTMALAEKRVLAVDCDFNMRSLDLIMGLEDNIVYDISDAAFGNVLPEKAVISDPRSENLFFCAAPYSSSEIPSKEQFHRVISAYASSGNYDYILIDTPGDARSTLELVAGCADTAVIVTTHQPAAIRAAERTGILVREYGTGESFLLINDFAQKEVKKGYHPGILSVIDRTGIRLIGAVPHDERISRFQENGILIPETNMVDCVAAFKNVAARLQGDDVPLFEGFNEKDNSAYL